MQHTINQPIKIPFTSVGLVTGLTAFTPVFLLNGVAITITPITYTEIGGGLYTINFTPKAVGSISLFVEQGLRLDIEIAQRTNTQVLQNLEDSSMGSWIWDKVAGTMKMIRQDGTLLANFNIVDTLNSASRERT
jgi:hypothetical protein